ncbi:MAG: hypothetical protein FWG77_06875 [Treponema sp.]|nr:hypothetical protein [Treponema sp.]
MIFNLPPILGLIPLILYIIMTIRGKDMVWSVLLAVIVGAVLTGKTLVQAGPILATALGSFLALIGLIIMLGAGLGEVLTRTRVAPNIVRVVMTKANIRTQNKAIIVTMLLCSVLVGMLGTLAGANAILAPIVISFVASIGLTPSTLGVIFHGAGAVGLMAGPFVPPVVTILGLTGLSYGAYLLEAGIPLAILLWIVTFVMAKKVQKSTQGVTAYAEEDKAAADFQVTPEVKRGTVVFIVGMVLMLGFGIYSRVGAAYATMVMLTMSFAVGLAAGLKPTQILEAIIAGCTRLFPLFFMFVLFDPLMNFIIESGAFTALTEYLQPVLAVGGKIGFMLVSTLIGIFGISGAAVAQSRVIHDLFGPMAVSLGIPMAVWALVIAVGSQLTSFAYPGADMLGQMGLARSKDIKSMMRNGITLTIVTVAYILLRSIILTIMS